MSYTSQAARDLAAALAGEPAEPTSTDRLREAIAAAKTPGAVSGLVSGAVAECNTPAEIHALLLSVNDAVVQRTGELDDQAAEAQAQWIASTPLERKLAARQAEHDEIVARGGTPSYHVDAGHWIDSDDGVDE